jgi:hypothetical protein
MLWLLPLLLAAGPSTDTRPPRPMAEHAIRKADGAVQAHDLLRMPARRIRAMDPRVVALMTDGARRSRTFADLILQVQRSTVIVYVEFHTLPPGTAGRLLLQSSAGRYRYLRVQVRALMPPDEIIAVIAHELRHALEVAADPSVVSSPGLEDLYRRIGFETQVHLGFDTDAARAAGNRVLAELRG